MVSRRKNWVFADSSDAIVLWQAESCIPKVRTLVTWNVKDFAGRTHLEVKSPQQYLRSP
ncbi:MAG: hypothetical protein HYZ28_05985 [Myxococcales bacterium]|nr:hypothetical protein [Myxococcales bacterium]